MRNLRHAASIRVPALRQIEPLHPALARNAIHQPVLAEDATGGPTVQGMLQRLRRAEALERNALGWQATTGARLRC
jgi:hypothetical protein